MPAEPSVTGMPISSSRCRMKRRPSGTSVPVSLRPLRSVQTVSVSSERSEPADTPRIAPAAAVSGGACIRCVSTHASERPTMSLLDDSMIWLTAVGSIRPCPCV